MKYNRNFYSKYPKFSRSLRSYSDDVCGATEDEEVAEEEVVLEPGDKLTTEDGEEIVVTESYSRNRIRYCKATRRGRGRGRFSTTRRPRRSF